MDMTRHARIKQIFLEACERPPGARATFLGQACGEDDALRREIEMLLAFHQEDDAQALSQPPPRAPAEEPPERIGPYRVVRTLGEGGMGIVYEVLQERPIRRRVALKLIKWGMDTRAALARFESERQVLALMSHGNIAAVYDAGATPEGRSYFVMEYVEGDSISAFCDRSRLGVQERIELFLQVCDGVQHAHQKGILHRDLKPSNILIALVDGVPVPKIIDFGVAKATQQRLTERSLYTERGVLVGTPEYMSPEQAEMGRLDLDIRTDVYSLGVILYDLLVGALPLDRDVMRRSGFDEIRRLIRECEPPTPSSRIAPRSVAAEDAARNRGIAASELRRQLRGDLDWITMKALEKDRDRRYGTVADLAADLRRHLRHEPVMAGPPGYFYRSAKFVRRHRAGAAATLVVTAALVTGVALYAAGLARARRSAETARQVSELLLKALSDMNLVSVSGDAPGAPEELLADALQRIDVDLEDQPSIQARLLTVAGAAYFSRGEIEEAEKLLQKAVQAGMARLGPDHLITAASMSNLGDLLRSLGRYDEAARMHERALEIRRNALGAEDVRVGWTLRSLGAVEQSRGNMERARTLYTQAVEIAGKAQGTLHPDTAWSQMLLGGLLIEFEEFEEAREQITCALGALEHTLGPDHSRVGEGYFILGLLQLRSGEREAARGNLERSLTILERALGGHNVVLSYPLNELAVVLISEGETEEARALLDRAYDLRLRFRGPDHPELAWTLTAYGYLYVRTGEIELARDFYRRGLEIQERALGPSHFEVARTLRWLATLEASQGDWAAAAPLAKRHVDILRALFPPGHVRLANPLYLLACVDARTGDREGALAALRGSVESGFADPIALEDPDLDSIRDDPRIGPLLAEVARRAGDETS